MKNKNIHRGVSHMPDAATSPVGKVARIHRNYRPNHGGVRKKRARGETRSKVFQEKLRFFVGSFALVFFLVLAYMIYANIKNHKNRSVTLTEEQELFQVAHPKEHEAVAIAQQFLTTKKIEDWGDLVRGSEDDKTRSMLEIAELKKDEWDFEAIQHIGPREVDGVFVDSLYVSDKVGNSRFLNLVHNGTRWQVDAASFAQLHSKPWQEFFDPKSTHGTARVFLTRESYYNGNYHDEALWQSYKIIHSASESSLTGYTRKGSACHLALEHIFKSGSPAQCILEIQRSIDAENTQYDIISVIAKDWILTDKIFSDVFSHAATDAKPPTTSQKSP